MRRNILYIIILLCLLTACSKKAKLPSDHIIFLDEDLKVRNMQRVTEGFINDEANIELIDFQSENILYPAYPFAGSSIEKFEKLSHSTEGIPLIDYKGEKRYYPILFCGAALSYYTHFLKTNSEKSKEEFLHIANYILNNAELIKDFAVLKTSLQVDNYNLPKEWGSAMAQGYAIVIMLQAYSLTQDNAYLEMSDKFINSFKYTLDEEGVLNYWDGYPFYEEYADPSSHVLNGYLFSLSGLYYGYRIGNSEVAKQLFDQGINTLKAKLSSYDAYFTSNYSKLRVGEKKVETYASAINEDPDHYHELHIYQLLTLYYWTNEYIFREYAHKFIKYDTGKINDYYEFNKFKSVTSPKNTDNIDILTDELWSWGKYWSTSLEEGELIIEFDTVRDNVGAVIFYSPNKNKLPENYAVYVWEKERWTLKLTNNELYNQNIKYYKTGVYETFIKIAYFPITYSTDKIKIVFNDTVALREINVLYDQNDKIDYIMKQIQETVFR